MGSFDQANQASWNFFSWAVNVAIGGAGSEKIIIPDFIIDSSNNVATNGFRTQIIHFTPIQIPAGTRIAAQAQSGTGTANQRVIGLTLYGLYQ